MEPIIHPKQGSVKIISKTANKIFNNIAVNLRFVSAISKEDFMYNGFSFPMILFGGINSRWIFDSYKSRNECYNKILKEYSNEL